MQSNLGQSLTKHQGVNTLGKNQNVIWSFCNKNDITAEIDLFAGKTTSSAMSPVHWHSIGSTRLGMRIAKLAQKVWEKMKKFHQ